ncbi:MAG: RloB domain-containing protein [Saprospiraceae bacterium]|nr:RloB domain-containing protein [Saprospiraceae bacterium]
MPYTPNAGGYANENFNNAISIAESYRFHVAYSNQAFEYWLILHFEDHQGGGMNRSDYCKKLNTYLAQFEMSYDCDGKMITQELFDILTSIAPNGKSYQQFAIERAKRNMEHFDNTNPALEESSTLVFKLVEELEKFK